MSWVTQTLPAGIALLALLWVPGIVVLRLLGLRGLVAWAAAPALTSGYVFVAANAAGVLGVAWRPWSAGALVVVEMIVTLALLGPVLGSSGRARLAALTPSFGGRRTSGRSMRRGSDGARSWHRDWWTRPRIALAGITAVSAIIFLVPAMIGMVTANAPLQQWDGIFHMNALRLVQDTGIASNLNGMYGDGVHVYYPATWHALVSLVPGPHGILPWVQITSAANASTLAFGAVVWPLAVAGWVWAVLPGKRRLTVIAVAIVGAFPMFPVVMWTIQAVWPNGTGVLLVPGASALVLLALRELHREGAGRRERIGLVVLALLATGGAAAMHGTALFDVALVVAPAVVVAIGGWMARRRRSGQRGRLLAGVAAGALLVAVVVVLGSRSTALRSLLGYDRPKLRDYWVSVPRTIVDWVITAWPGNLVLTVCIMVGAVAVWRLRSRRWVVVSWALIVAVAAIAAGPDNPLRALTGIWYEQPMRIEALYPMLAALLGAVGIAAVARFLVERSRTAPTGGVARVLRWTGGGQLIRSRSMSEPVVGATVWLLLVSFILSAGYQAPSRAAFFGDAYDPSSLKWGTMATAQELALLRDLPRYVEPGSSVIGSPYSGIPLAYVLSGVPSVYLQLGSAYAMDANRVLLRSRFRDLHTDSEICTALRAVHADYFYDDRATPAADGAWNGKDAPGFVDVDVSTGFQPLATAGKATLYRITACDGKAGS